MSSQSSLNNNPQEKPKDKPSDNKDSANDVWKTVPKKKSKRKRKKLGVPNISTSTPAYERHINCDFSGLPDQRIAYVSKLLRSNGVNSILELGCGDLTNSIKYLKGVEQFTSLTAVDIDSVEIKRGVVFALGGTGKHSKVRIFVGDATAPCKE